MVSTQHPRRFRGTVGTFRLSTTTQATREVRFGFGIREFLSTVARHVHLSGTPAVGRPTVVQSSRLLRSFLGTMLGIQRSTAILLSKEVRYMCMHPTLPGELGTQPSSATSLTHTEVPFGQVTAAHHIWRMAMMNTTALTIGRRLRYQVRHILLLVI